MSVSSTEAADELALSLGDQDKLELPRESVSQLRRSSRIRQTNVTMDKESVQRERLIRLDRSKSAALAAVSAKRNEIQRLMERTNSFQQVKNGASGLTEMFQRYLDAQKKFMSAIADEDYKKKVVRDFDETIKRVSEFEQKLKDWLLRTEANIISQQEIQPSDSASQVTNLINVTKLSKASSRHSSQVSSKRSSILAVRVQETARMAELNAETIALKQKHALQKRDIRLDEEKLKLSMEMEQLNLKTEFAKAEAREKIFAEAEAVDDGASKIDTGQNHTKFSQISEEIPRKISELKTIDRADYTPQTKPVKDVIRQYRAQPVVKRDREQDQKVLPQHSYNLKSTIGIHNNEDSDSMLSEADSNHDSKFPSHEPEFNILGQQNRIMEELVIQQQRATLPRRDMFTFDGDLTKYRAFIRAFEALIEVKEPDCASKLYYLEQYTSGRGKELVRSCLQMPPNEGYSKARALLEHKFGCKHKIAMAHVEQLTKGNPIKSEDGDLLEQFSITLMSSANTLKSIGYLNKIENPDTMKKIIERLPYKLQERWRDVADRIINIEEREVTIEDISKFVEIRARSMNNPVFGRISYPSKEQNIRPRGLRPRQYPAPGSRPTSFATQVDERAQRKPTEPNQSEASVKTETMKSTCPCCGAIHLVAECPSFEKRSYLQRLEFVKKHRLCFACLKGGHQSKTCFRRKPCKECSGKHSTLLHIAREPGQSDTTNNSNEADKRTIRGIQYPGSARCGFATTEGSVTALPIVPVKIRSGSTDYIETYALMDGGSNSTFCTDSLRKRLRCNGKERKVKLTTIGTTEDVVTVVLNDLEVADLDENVTISLPDVLCRPSIPVSKDEIPTQEDVDRWRYLQGYVYLPNLNSDVELLIGANVPEALQPQQIIGSRDGGPYASKVALGWVINGPTGRKSGSTQHASFFTKTEVHPMCEVCTDFIDASDFNKEMSRYDLQFMSIVESSVKKW